MNPERPSLTALGRCARSVVWTVFAYWGVIALICPVMTIDSQMYNLTRVELALRDGFFGSDYFTSVFHIVFPWSFDALHLPFILLGWGYALPSYLCLVGTSLVVLTMIRARLGPDVAWVGVLSLLALPCLVYQATSTKNDIGLLFSIAIWVYARWRRNSESRDSHLIWMVLAIGFQPGVKTTGLPIAAGLAGWTLWEVRANRRLWCQTAAGLGGAVLLFGSIETCLESAR